jgi:response regulator RpfG family c-di-GMP phosphodiesterase
VPGWAVWSLIGLAAWTAISLVVGLLFGRVAAVMDRVSPEEELEAEPAFGAAASLIGAAPAHEKAAEPARAAPRRILLVDDDADVRLLLRTTLPADEYVVEEASSAEEATDVARFWRPWLVILDVGLPGASGLEFCAELKRNSAFGFPRVILLTGGETSPAEASAAGADTLLRKPFSPLGLLAAVDRLGEGAPVLPEDAETASSDQLLAYARDLSRILEIERGQRRLLQHAYRQTVAVLTDVLEAKNRGTGLHAVRVHRYALELTEAVDPSLLDDPSLEYGFLLHDIGKIVIPDSILEKPGPLRPAERRLMQRHPVIGAEILSDIALLAGQGLEVVRSHHERWDGKGYPAGLGEEEIPAGARIFAVADTLDAMTTDRPYRGALDWATAVAEILRESGRQFDPEVVGAFADHQQQLRRSHWDLVGIAS